MRECPWNGVRQEQRQQRLEVEWGTGRLRHLLPQQGSMDSTVSGDGTDRTKHSLENHFAGSVGGLEKIGEVLELAGVQRE